VKYSEVDILNFVEGRFNDVQTADFLAEHRSNPELAAAVQRMQASLVPINKAYQQQAMPPVPESIRQKLELLKSAETSKHDDTKTITPENKNSDGSDNHNSNSNGSNSKVAPINAAAEINAEATHTEKAAHAESNVANTIDTGNVIDALTANEAGNESELRNSRSQNRIHPNSNSRFGKLSTMGLAACLVSGIGIGAIASQLYIKQNATQQNTQPQNSLTAAGQQSAQLTDATTHHRWVERVADYQTLYVANTVANLSETRVADANKLIASVTGTSSDASAQSQSLGQSLGQSEVQTKIPDFSDHGYQFARAQELGFEGKTLVQLVYSKPGDTPLALCFMAESDVKDLPVKLSKHHQLNAASWITDNQHFVLVADESDAVLNQMHSTAAAVF